MGTTDLHRTNIDVNKLKFTSAKLRADTSLYFQLFYGMFYGRYKLVLLLLLLLLIFVYMLICNPV